MRGELGKGRFFSESMMHFSHCPKNVPKHFLGNGNNTNIFLRISDLYARNSKGVQKSNFDDLKCPTQQSFIPQEITS